MNLASLIPIDQEVIFACVGTDRSTGDCVGPLVGTWLEEKGYTVVGTLEHTLNAINLTERILAMKEMYPNHFVVAIDACLGKVDRIGHVVIEKGPLFPGKAVRKELPPVGDVSIKAIVNVGGFQEYTVLQNTRFNVSWKLAKEITAMCDSVMITRALLTLEEVGATK
jgi:putative sporulation protein YyaC